MLSCFPLLLVILAIAAASVIPEKHLVHERRDADRGQQWVRKTRVPADAILPMRIGLQQNAEALRNSHQWLMDVADPESEHYGHHWTQDEVIKAFRPADATLSEVKNWLTVDGSVLNEHIIHTENKAWFAFNAAAGKMERLLNTTFFEHEHQRTGSLMIACDAYSLPSNLAGHIDYITPGVKGTVIKGYRSQKTSSVLQRQSQEDTTPTRRSETYVHSASLSNCDKLITPACLQALYNFDALDPNAPVQPNNSMGIFEVSSSYRQDDLDRFYEAYAPRIPQGWKPVFESIDGGITPAETKMYKLDNDNAEAELDFQVAIPIIYPQTATDFQTDDPNAGYYEGIMNTFFDAIDGSYCTYSAYGETGNAPGIDPTYPDTRKGQFDYNGTLQCGVWKPTNVVTTSYPEYEDDLPYYYVKRQCNEILKLGLQGVSVFEASGDIGVAGDDPHTSTGCYGKDGKVFSNTGMGGCPYVTTVGATKMLPGSTVKDQEVAASNASRSFYSSGGFSNIFTRPDYQGSAISEYFQKHNPPYPYYYDGRYNQSAKGVYNRNGKGIPDVSANGQSIATYWRGKPFVEEGTSASSPIFAAIVTRINEERLKVGKQPVGFINPVLYKYPEMLNDITQGNNPGCKTEGFSAVQGWDPVTGLGTPNYPKMLEKFLSLP